MISKEQAVRIVIEQAISDGARPEDIARMQKDVHDEGTEYTVTLYPKTNQERFDVQYTVDKKTGRIVDVVSASLDEAD